MDENRLGDQLNPPDDRGFKDSSQGLGGEMFQQEANTLKIEKLSQRVTIISVIIPCIIIAIVAFVYMDITEKVVDVDQTQADQMAQVSQDLEIKLNALDERIVKATHELDEKLSALETKRQALENQTAKMSAAKVDLKAMEAALAKLDKRIKANADQDKSTLATMERINQQLLSAIDKNGSNAKTAAEQIKKQIHLLKQEFDTRLLELSDYDQKIAQLTKQTSLVGQNLDKLKKQTASSLDKKTALLRQDLEKQIAQVKKRADTANTTAKKAAATAASAKSAKTKPAAKPEPSSDKPGSSSSASPAATAKPKTTDLPTQQLPGTGGILEQDLSQ